MFKIFITMMLSLIITITMSGCTYLSNLKNHFFKKDKDTQKQFIDETQEEPEHKDSGPIPTNPQHS